MGMTATFCTRNVAKAVTVDGRDAIPSAELSALRDYMASSPCVAGVPEDYSCEASHASLLASAYVSLVNGELAGHGGDPFESIDSVSLLGQVFGYLWLLPTELSADLHPSMFLASRGQAGELNHLHKSVEALHGRTAQIPQSAPIASADGTTLSLARLLAGCYVKAYVELKFATRSVERDVARHHAALLGDIIVEMNRLVMNLGDQTEARLSSRHPHAANIGRTR